MTIIAYGLSHSERRSTPTNDLRESCKWRPARKYRFLLPASYYKAWFLPPLAGLKELEVIAVQSHKLDASLMYLTEIPPLT
jgi:hypothetical protein